MKVSMTLDRTQLAALRNACAATGKKLPRELSIAVNKTAKVVRKDMVKDVFTGLRLPKAEISKRIKVVGRANRSKLASNVTLFGTSRLSLKWFAYKQTSAGIPYKIEKTGKRNVAKGAFQGPKPRVVNPKLKNAVWKRVGKSRYPLARLHGVSIGPFFESNGLPEKTIVKGGLRLSYEVNRRIRKIVGGF